MSNILNKCHPDVAKIILPIMQSMTEIEYKQKCNPIVGPENEPQIIKMQKRLCIHMTLSTSNDDILRLKRNEEGILVCQVCGRPIYAKFDDTAVTKITDAISVVNQVLVFGLMNGIMDDNIKILLQMKQLLPEVAKMSKSLNDFVRRENSNADSADNLGVEYMSNGYRSITEM
jgi:hypothetical protein